MKLVERKGDMVLELYNYEGSQKAFWELNWPGFFFKGKVQCGFYLEVASKSEFENAQAFAKTILSGNFSDFTDPALNFTGTEERLWSVSYQRDSQALGIEIDLLSWQLKRRWTQEGNLAWPMLESFRAKQNATGFIECNGATLECGAESAWLYANPETDLYVVGYHGNEAGSLRLTMPNAVVTLAAMGLGTLVWHKGELKVDALIAKDIKTMKKDA